VIPAVRNNTKSAEVCTFAEKEHHPRSAKGTSTHDRAARGRQFIAK